MKRCNWDGTELNDEARRIESFSSKVVDPFEYLPQSVAFTPEMEEMADRYIAGDIQWESYAAQQAAQFLRPRSKEQHETRRNQFAELHQQVETMGYSLPKSLCTLVNNDSYMDRLHHNTIWLSFPQELWQLPSQSDKLMFLVFSECQGCGHWHLLLAPDHSHCVVVCEEAFGCPSDWPGEIPDFGKFEIKLCADSFDEWLTHYFLDSARDDAFYLRELEEWLGYNPNG